MTLFKLLTLLISASCLVVTFADGFNEVFDEDDTASHSIYGGEEMEFGSRPYLVSLGYGETGFSQKCAGSVISPHAVLTAAHCLFHPGIEEWDPPLWVELNRYHLCDDTEDVERVYLDGAQCVGDIIYHPEYNFTSNVNDVAILFLSTAIKGIEPVILNNDPNKPADGDPLDVAGWGKIDGGFSPDITHSVTLQYLTNEACVSKPFKLNVGEITDEMMCAFAKKKDSCVGDSGGPLVMGKDEPEGGPQTPVVQVGIVSFGYGCASKRYPGVYTRVSSVLDWIEDTVCDRTGALCKKSKRKPRMGSIQHIEKMDANECVEFPVYDRLGPPKECPEQPASKSGKSIKKPKSGKSNKAPKSGKSKSIKKKIFE